MIEEIGNLVRRSLRELMQRWATSLGIGRRAFAGDSSYTIMNAIAEEEPSALQASAPLEKIVRRCLAKQPSGRYQTISEIKTALEQVFGKKGHASSAEPQPSIAVLPFVNMSGDKEQEYFSDGLAEKIILPCFPLRSHPRSHALLRKMNLSSGKEE